MHSPLPTTGLIAHSKALEAAGIAISLVMRVPAPLKSLADQVIRSASSVPANLSEGHGRSGRDRPHPDSSRLKHARKILHRGVPGTALCRYDLPAAQRTAHNADAGQPTGTAIRCICSRSEGGRRSREQRGRQPSNFPPRDLADRATLGRQGRPRRPEHPGTVTESETVAATAHEYVEAALHRGGHNIVPLGSRGYAQRLAQCSCRATHGDNDPVHLSRPRMRPPLARAA